MEASKKMDLFVISVVFCSMYCIFSSQFNPSVFYGFAANMLFQLIEQSDLLSARLFWVLFCFFFQNSMIFQKTTVFSSPKSSKIVCCIFSRLVSSPLDGSPPALRFTTGFEQYARRWQLVGGHKMLLII